MFSLILAIGASFGLLWIVAAVPAAQRIHWLLATWIALLLALIGARAGYALEHLSYFSIHTNEILRFWLGGLIWEGALAGGLLSLPLIAKIWQWPFTLVADRMSRLLFPLGIAGWAATWWSGLGYGVPLDAGIWWGMNTRDEAGLVSLRTPVQPVAILSLIVFLGVLEMVCSRWEKRGRRGALTLFLFSADMLLLTFLRADPSPTLFGLRFESWLAMVYTLFGLLSTIDSFIKIPIQPVLHWPRLSKKTERKLS
jgi:Prolipoprotein diacylglyceryltransferase